MTRRLAHVNGRLLPESEACVSIRDVGLVYGDCVFDTARTFGGKLFLLEAHVDRLLASLALVRLAAGMTREGFIEATRELVAANLPVLRRGEDYWVTIRVTGGVQSFDGEPPDTAGPTVIIDCVPLPLRARARFFRDGIDARISARPRIAPEALTPNAKTNNYLNMMLAQREVAAEHPDAWALMPDADGNIAEGAGCNFFAVKDGEVVTPRETHVLAGISRQVVLDICAELGIAARQADISPAEALAADEAFFTSTSLCACPVGTLEGHPYPAGVPGPVTRRIMETFAARVGMDYVAQYLAFVNESTGRTGL